MFSAFYLPSLHNVSLCALCLKDFWPCTLKKTLISKVFLQEPITFAQTFSGANHVTKEGNGFRRTPFLTPTRQNSTCRNLFQLVKICLADYLQGTLVNLCCLEKFVVIRTVVTRFAYTDCLGKSTYDFKG